MENVTLLVYKIQHEAAPGYDEQQFVRLSRLFPVARKLPYLIFYISSYFTDMSFNVCKKCLKVRKE